MTGKTRKILTIIGITLSFASFYGCTVIHKVPYVQIDYPQKNKIHLTVALLLSDKFRHTQWKDGKGNEDILDLGDAFAKDAEKLSKAIFSKVIIINHYSNIPTPQTDIDAILIPKVITLKKSRPMTIFESILTTLIFEWTLKNKDGDIIWIDTINLNLECPGCTGITATGKVKKHGEQIVRELFQRSFETLSTAQEIKKYAASL